MVPDIAHNVHHPHRLHEGLPRALVCRAVCENVAGLGVSVFTEYPQHATERWHLILLIFPPVSPGPSSGFTAVMRAAMTCLSGYT